MLGRFKYLISVFVVIILFSGLVYSDVSLWNLTIDVNVNEDGSAFVRETYVLKISGNETMNDYSSNLKYLQQNNLQAWKERLNFTELKYHFGGYYSPIEDLLITPTQLYGINWYTEEALAKITLDYTVKSPTVHDNQTFGLFIITHPKPRVTRYTLNTKALGFDITDDGDVILPSHTSLRFHLKDDMYVYYVQPLPNNVDIEHISDVNVKDLVWSNKVLPKFTLIIEKEGSLESEIVEYLDHMNKVIYGSLTGREGIPIVIILIIVIVSVIVWYFYIDKKRLNK